MIRYLPIRCRKTFCSPEILRIPEGKGFNKRLSMAGMILTMSFLGILVSVFLAEAEIMSL
jgi:hypothetical protein